MFLFTARSLSSLNIEFHQAMPKHVFQYLFPWGKVGDIWGRGGEDSLEAFCAWNQVITYPSFQHHISELFHSVVKR